MGPVEIKAIWSTVVLEKDGDLRSASNHVDAVDGSGEHHDVANHHVHRGGRKVGGLIAERVVARGEWIQLLIRADEHVGAKITVQEPAPPSLERRLGRA